MPYFNYFFASRLFLGQQIVYCQQSVLEFPLLSVHFLQCMRSTLHSKTFTDMYLPYQKRIVSSSTYGHLLSVQCYEKPPHNSRNLGI